MTGAQEERMDHGQFAEWPGKWFGYWQEHGPAYHRCPSIEDFIDEDWQYGHRAELVNYLATAPIAASTSHMAFGWLKGKGDGRTWMSVRTDGEWAWLDDVAYYVAEQALRLPDAFVAAIESRNFTPPSEAIFDHVDPMALPSPPV
jgi:hypothetical protein